MLSAAGWAGSFCVISKLLRLKGLKIDVKSGAVGLFHMGQIVKGTQAEKSHYWNWRHTWKACGGPVLLV